MLTVKSLTSRIFIIGRCYCVCIEDKLSEEDNRKMLECSESLGDYFAAVVLHEIEFV